MIEELRKLRVERQGILDESERLKKENKQVKEQMKD